MITFQGLRARTGLRVWAGLKPAPTFVIGIVAFLAAIPATAFAGNDDEILIGTQGARLGGAVTATVTDSTALWYNPGAIGRTRWAQFGVSGTLVQLRVDRTELLGNDVDVSVVPATLGHEIPLPNDWSFAYGIFTSRSHKRAGSVDNAIGGGIGSTRSDWTSNDDTYNFGAGLGAPLGSSLRVGLGAFAVYGNQSNMVSNTRSDGSAFSSTLRSEALSSFVSLGFHWAPTPALNIGLAVNSPRMLLISDVSSNGMKSSPGFSPSAPLRVRAGAAYDFGRLILSLDGDVQPALTNDDVWIERRLVPNARLGADYEIDEQTHLGLGLFSDLAPEKNKDARVDFFGVAGGIETTTRYKLDPNEPAESIEISAFIGFRYALGMRSNPDVTSHEIGINLGSGLRF